MPVLDSFIDVRRVGHRVLVSTQATRRWRHGRGGGGGDQTDGAREAAAQGAHSAGDQSDAIEQSPQSRQFYRVYVVMYCRLHVNTVQYSTNTSRNYGRFINTLIDFVLLV